MLLLRRITDILDAEDVPEAEAARRQPAGPAAVPTAAGASGCGSSQGSDWEVVRGAGGAEAAARAAADEDSAAEEAAAAAAAALRAAATAAESLAPRLQEALRRARSAESEAARLARLLAEAEGRVEALQGQQLRLTEGFLGELRQRDAELAALRAALEASGGGAGHSVSTAPWAGEAGRQDVPTLGQTDLLTFTAPGVLGVEFDRSNASLKVVASVEASGAAAGRLFPGDEVTSIDGASARNMTWEEFEVALGKRPAVVSVRRGEQHFLEHSYQGAGTRIASRVRDLAGWTRNAAKAAARELEAAMAELEEESTGAAGQSPGAVSSSGEAPGSAAGGGGAAAADVVVDFEPMSADAEARNQPFYDLVRGSMAEVWAASVDRGAAGSRAREEELFESWLRQFHSERDDAWYANNHARVYNAFKPHWEDVIAGKRGATPAAIL